MSERRVAPSARLPDASGPPAALRPGACVCASRGDVSAVYDGDMRRHSFVSLALVASCLVACGGASYERSPAQYAPERDYAQPGSTATSAPSEPQADYGGVEEEKSASVDGQYVAPSSRPEPSKPADKPAPSGLEERLVVYTGYLKLRVKRLLAAVDAITALTEKAGGYVESLTQRVVVVRVPRGDFDATMKAFADLGTVVDRRVKALDVTQQFTDLQARLVVARDTRERLLALLEKTTHPEERRRILQEVKRLTEQIESMSSTLATLQNLVDFYTITIELEPVLDNAGAQTHRSPFAWVRALAPHLQSIEEGRDELDMTLPDGFVLFDEDDAWRAQSADTSVLRAGLVENEPRGDAGFWADAVDHEMEGRDEERVDAGESGRVVYRVYRDKDVQPRWYLVGLHVDGERLFVVEAFFPNEDAWKRHHENVVKALSTFRVQ